MRNVGWYDVIQIFLLSLTIACLIIAISSYAFGSDNLLQLSPFPFPGIVILGFMWLMKLGMKKSKM